MRSVSGVEEAPEVELGPGAVGRGGGTNFLEGGAFAPVVKNDSLSTPQTLELMTITLQTEITY